jgi:hypothetical protein
MTLCACNLIVESGYIFPSSQALLHLQVCVAVLL